MSTRSPQSPGASPRLSPYQGLRAFDEEDAPFFFGREKETRLIIANLFAAPLTLLYGASGVGKSSVLRAGVVHQLRQRDDLLPVVCNAWQGDPVGSFKVAVFEAARLATGAMAAPADSASLAEYLITTASSLNRRLIFILDQFEDYFLYHPEDSGKGSFDVEFPLAVTQADQPLSFLIAIREDFLARLDRFEGRMPTLFDNYLRLEHLNRSAAAEAIVKPVAQYNRLLAEPETPFSVEPLLVESTIEQVKTGQVFIGQAGRGQIARPERTEAQVETPYLQLVMARVWQEERKRQSRILRLVTLTSLGGAREIVRTHLDTVMEKLKPSQQETAAYIFEHLVTPSGNKIAHTVTDLAGYSQIPAEQVTAVVRRLAEPDLRILRPVDLGTEAMAQPRYEIFHETLAPAISDWRARYFGRVTFLGRAALPAIYLVLGTIVIQSFLPLPPAILFLARALSLVVLNTAALLQVYRWFYRAIRLRVTMLPLAGLGGPNVGILLGILFTGFWFLATEWPQAADPSNPLGTISALQYVQYLFTVMPTLLFGLITFLLMRLMGEVTDRFFKRFDFGFYGSYFGVCGLIALLIILDLLGALVLPKWIAFPPPA